MHKLSRRFQRRSNSPPPHSAERGQLVTDRTVLDTRRRSRPLIYALNRMLITFSFALLSAIAITLVVKGFTVSTEVGVKSLAAAALPPVIITYISLYSRSSVKFPERLPEVPLFVAAAVWLIALMLFVNAVDDYANGIPFGSLVTALTFSLLVFLARHIAFASMLSCSYGVVSGLLLYTLLFGFSGPPG